MGIVVIGGGAAGLMAAGFAAQTLTQAGLPADVTVLERGPRLARKVRITGKGRCNLTNNCSLAEFIDHVPENGRFLYSALSSFSPQDTMAWFEEQGVAVKTERGNRVFPSSDKAADVVQALSAFVQQTG